MKRILNYLLKHRFNILYFAIAFMVWLAIQAFTQQLPVFKQIQYDATDKIVDIVRGAKYKLSSERERVPNNFKVLVIDEETHLKWQQPLTTPRHHLKDIIQNLYLKGVQVIYLDFSFLRNEAGLIAPFTSSNDLQLIKKLQDVSKEVTLILNLPLQRLASDSLFSVPKDSIFDLLKSKNIIWVNHTLPVFEDAKIREFAPITKVCINGYIKYVPSAALVLSEAIFTNGNEVHSSGQMIQLNKNFPKIKCGSPNQFNDYSFNEMEKTRTIEFSVGDDLSEKSATILNRLHMADFLDDVDNNESVIQLPKVVLVGSQIDKDDIHPISLGVELPGIFILVHAALTYAEYTESSKFLETLTSLLIFLFIAMIYRWIRKGNIYFISRELLYTGLSLFIFTSILMIGSISLLALIFPLWIVMNIADKATNYIQKKINKKGSVNEIV